MTVSSTDSFQFSNTLDKITENLKKVPVEESVD